MGEVELPRGIALAWGIAADPQRGPKRELSIEKIVDAAIEIADTDGLGAVSMGSVAARLGYTTMSLYRYVSAKNDLIALMNDEGLGEPPDHEPVDDDWQSGLRRWTSALSAVYIRHPWLLDIPIDGIPMMPNNLAWLDWGLRLLAPARLSPQGGIGAMMMLSGLMRWQATIDRSTASGDQQETAQFVFTEFVTADRYPALACVVAAGGIEDDTEDPFRFALERAIAGLERIAGLGDERPPAPVVPGEDFDYPRDAKLRAATKARREAEAKLREALRKETELIAKAKKQAGKA